MADLDEHEVADSKDLIYGRDSSKYGADGASGADASPIDTKSQSGDTQKESQKNLTSKVSTSEGHYRGGTRYGVGRYWLDDVEVKHGDLLLFACCLVQGLLDASAFRNWGTFVGMQTGNTIILALSTGKLPSGQPWAFGLTLISIVSFFVGCFIATRICTLLSPIRRLTLTGNFLCQTILIILAAALTTGSVMVTDANEELDVLLKDPRILIGIAPLSLQSGMTIATSRMIGYGNEIPVVVYTSTYAALAGDKDLFLFWPPSANKPRNRRIIAVLCVFVGAVIATWVEIESIGMVAIFWMAAGIKLVLSIVVALLLPHKPKPRDGENRA